MVEILNKYKENVLALAQLHNEIESLKQEQSSTKEKIDSLGNQIKDLDGQRELNKTIIDKYELTIYMIRDISGLASILFGFGLILSFTLHSLTQIGLENGFYLITGGTQESMKQALEHGKTMFIRLLGFAGFSTFISVPAYIFTPGYLKNKYDSCLEYRTAKDEHERLQADIKRLETEKQQAQAEYDSIDKQLKQKEEEIRKLVRKNDFLVAEYVNIDARNKMNQAINQEWNPEVVRAVNALGQIVEEYKPSDDKRKSFNLFPSILN